MEFGEDVPGEEAASSSAAEAKKRGPQKRAAIWKIDAFEEDGELTKCKLCPYSLKGRHGTSLVNHLERHHPEKFDQWKAKKQKLEEEANVASAAKPTALSKQQPITAHFR